MTIDQMEKIKIIRRRIEDALRKTATMVQILEIARILRVKTD